MCGGDFCSKALDLFQVHNRHERSKGQLVELLEKVALHNLQALPGHDRQVAIENDFVKRLLAGNHILNIAPESILIPSRDDYGTMYFFRVLSKRSHLGELLAIRFNFAEVFVDPENNILGLGRLGQLVKAVQGIEQSLAAGNNRMYVNTATLFSQIVERALFSSR